MLAGAARDFCRLRLERKCTACPRGIYIGLVVLLKTIVSELGHHSQ